MTIADDQQARNYVANLIGLRASVLHVEKCADSDAFYVWEPARGGTQVIVGRDGSILTRSSAIDPEVVKHEFAAGERTNLAYFDDLREYNLRTRTN